MQGNGKDMASNHNFILGPLTSDAGRVRREARKRKMPYDVKPVNKDQVEKYESLGWEVDKKLKTKIRVKRFKPHDERLENRLWTLLFRLGYPELNEGRNFQIAIKRKGADPVKKQIDVFAKDNETVIVAECKSAKKLGRKSLQKDIEEFGNLKGPIARAIKEYYGHDFKPKIVWLFVTENVVWSKPDRERAGGQNVRIITERELRYYLQIADHLKTAARYQVLAEFLKDQDIPGLTNVVVPAIRGKLGGRKFYSFVTTPSHLLKIAFVNHRSLNDPDGAPTYQRLVGRSRLRQIGQFLQNGGFFPTNILVNFVRRVRFDIVKRDELADVAYGQLYLPNRYRSAWIIDGQHRLYGFAHLEEEYLNQNIVIIAFEQMPIEQEADLFVTINHEQKSVPKTLLDDLEGELKWGSDVPSERIGSVGARLINILNADIGEPFYNRVTQQGIKATNRTCLTVPALKDGLRRSGLLGRPIMKRKVYEPGPFSGSQDSETLDRARSAMNHFFSLIRDSNQSQWEKGRTGFLCTNVAIQGHLFLLSSLIKYMEVNKGLDPKQLTPQEIIMELEEYVDPVLEYLAKANDLQIEKDFRVPFGSGGPPEYYYRLCWLVKKEFADFIPEGMDDWEAEQSGEKIAIADSKIKKLNVKVQAHIFNTFKKKYGSQKDAY
ncbi:MAG TPA: DGQHR domain-containing protein, partial [Desulfatiglandales bacterium]|nr:DGQHR domain-containing protein [Desulfatiglandales bacterium]